MNSTHQKSYTRYLLFLLLFMTTSLLNHLQAQCSFPPAAGACSGGNGQASNGENINSGQSFWYAGTGTFPSGVNLNGGTLRVCGQLTLSSLNFNSGSIFVEAGGILTIDGGGSLNMNGNSIISNRGQLIINKSVVMQNAGNSLYNATESAVLTMNGGSYELNINSSTSIFVNNGTADIYSIVVQGSASGAPVCMGASSCMNLTNISNNLNNSFAANAGPAVLRYTGNALLNSNLSSNASVIVCRATGSTTSGGANFGSATVINNCESCSFAFLPIELLSFTGSQEKETIALEWTTETEINNDYFSVEKSANGLDWQAIETIPGAGNHSGLLRYAFEDKYPNAGLQYYRLKQTDYNGMISISASIAVNFEMTVNSIAIYPNPNQSNHLSFRGMENGIPYTLELRKITGELLQTFTFNTNSIELPVMSNGVYLITIASAGQFGPQIFRYIVL